MISSLSGPAFPALVVFSSKSRLSASLNNLQYPSGLQRPSLADANSLSLQVHRVAECNAVGCSIKSCRRSAIQMINHVLAFSDCFLMCFVVVPSMQGCKAKCRWFTQESIVQAFVRKLLLQLLLMLHHLI